MDNERELKLLIEMIDDESVSGHASLLKQMQDDLDKFKEIDPRGYNDWMKRLINFQDEIAIDLRKAIRWSTLK
jgi:hypothetical protein